MITFTSTQLHSRTNAITLSGMLSKQIRSLENKIKNVQRQSDALRDRLHALERELFNVQGLDNGSLFGSDGKPKPEEQLNAEFLAWQEKRRALSEARQAEQKQPQEA